MSSICSSIDESIHTSNARDSQDLASKLDDRSYDDSTMAPSVVQSYSMDSFEADSGDEDQNSQLYSYDADTFESAPPISESVFTAYSLESFESTIESTVGKDGYSRDSFESSTTGETVTRANFSSTIYSDRSRSDEDTDSINSYSDSMHSVLASPRKSGSLENKEENEKSFQARQEFLNRLMCHLKSEHKQPAPERDQPEKPLSKSEKYMKKFCKKKIQSIQNQKDQANKEKPRGNETVHPLNTDRTRTSDEYGIPASFIERLKITNMIESMQQACDAEIHEPKKCKICRSKLAEIRAERFVTDRRAKALDKLIKSKMDEHLYLRDELTLIGDIMKDMPNPRQNFTQVMMALQQKYTPQTNDISDKSTGVTSHGLTQRTYPDRDTHVQNLRKIMNNHGLELDLDVPNERDEVWQQLMHGREESKLK